MPSRWSQAAAPAYLLLCLILGGSVQGVFGNMVLQLVGLGLLAWAAIVPGPKVRLPVERQLYALILLALALIAIQLVPLPPSIWPHLGGRAILVEGYRVLGIPVPALSISVAPYDTVATALTLIPPLALLATILRIGSRPLWLIGALLAGLFAGILLGILQVGTPAAGVSPWYLYADTNVGVATGFFANANHMATLLLISIPFLAALLGSARSQRAGLQHYSGVIALVAAAAMVVLVGVALNGSLAGYGLAVPVIAASTLLLLRPRSSARLWVGLGTALLLVGVLVGLMVMPLDSSLIRSQARTSVQSRHEILATSLRATADFLPLGSGIGTFERVYALYEDHGRLDPTTTVNHAHDDYVELALEAGAPGVLLMALFLLWWARAALSTWTTGDSGPFARAAAIASAAILVHSIVDFPLRTSAISTCFAMCIALLVRWRPITSVVVEKNQLRPARHVVLR